MNATKSDWTPAKTISTVPLSKKDVYIFKTKFCKKCGRELSIYDHKKSTYCQKCSKKKVKYIC